MSEEFKTRMAAWLQAAPMTRGTLLRGIRFPDETFLTDLDARDFPVTALEQAWRLVGDTFQVLSAQRFPPRRLTWVYEKTALHCAQRPDGIIFGVFVARSVGGDYRPAVDRLLADFDNFKP